MRLIKLASLAIIAASFIIACQSEAVQPTPYPTYTAFPTYTPYPTYTPFPPPSQSRLPSAQIENLIWPTGPKDDVIPFEDAADFMGEKITVEGTVARTHNSGNAVFLNFSDGGKDAFTAVIFPDDWPKFPSAPEHLFAGKLVRVEGVIEEYKGTPEIIIKNPSQIEVALTLGQPIITDCQCQQQQASIQAATAMPNPTSTEAPTSPAITTPEPATTPESSPIVTTGNQIVPWQEAAVYEGQTITVAGKIVNTYNSGKVVFLNFDEDYSTTFKVVIFPEAWPLFPAPPEDHYHSKTIQVTGQIEMYRNTPEIIVDHPDQIQIME